MTKGRYSSSVKWTRIEPSGAEAGSIIGVVHKFGDFPDEKYDFNPDALRRLLGPGVYFLAKFDGLTFEYLYIGSAKNILARMSDETHDMLRRALCEANWVYVKKAKSEDDARKMEARYINQKQPKYNKTGKIKRFFFPRRADEDSFLIEEFEDYFREALRNRLA